MRATRLREGGPLGRSPDGLVDGARDNPFAIWARGNTIDGKLVALELCLLLGCLNIPNPEGTPHINVLCPLSYGRVMRLRARR